MNVSVVFNQFDRFSYIYTQQETERGETKASEAMRTATTKAQQTSSTKKKKKIKNEK